MTIDEHALTIKEEITEEQIEYLVKKANRLGKNGRTINAIQFKAKEDSKDIFFIADNLSPKHNFCPY